MEVRSSKLSSWDQRGRFPNLCPILACGDEQMTIISERQCMDQAHIALSRIEDFAVASAQPHTPFCANPNRTGDHLTVSCLGCSGWDLDEFPNFRRYFEGRPGLDGYVANGRQTVKISQACQDL